MKYSNLLKIATYLEAFEQENSPTDFEIESFSYWLLGQLNEQKKFDIETDAEGFSAIEKQLPDVQISILIGRMGKYARIYTKQILQKHQLNGLDDYTFMATLMFNQSMTKSELINHNLMDSATSGTEVIKRLIKNGFVEDYNDPVDKRSKRVRITDKGKTNIMQVFAEMDRVAKVISGNLEANEKLHLLKNLKKLEHFHKQIFDNDRKGGLDEIEKKYLK